MVPAVDGPREAELLLLQVVHPLNSVRSWKIKHRPSPQGLDITVRKNLPTTVLVSMAWPPRSTKNVDLDAELLVQQVDGVDGIARDPEKRECLS